MPPSVSHIQVPIQCLVPLIASHNHAYSFGVTCPSVSHNHIITPIIWCLLQLSHISTCLFGWCLVLQVPHIITHPSVSHRRVPICSIYHASMCIIPPECLMHCPVSIKALMMIWFARLSKCSAIILESMHLVGQIARIIGSAICQHIDNTVHLYRRTCAIHWRCCDHSPI